MPFIRNNAGKKSTVANAGKSERPQKIGVLRSPITDNANGFKRQLTELGNTLNFTDDVISSRSPQSVPYAKARVQLRSLYKPSDLDLGQRRMKATGGRLVGRHDCRGEPRRHMPCYLSDVEDAVPVTHHQRRRRGRLERSLTVPLVETSRSDVGGGNLLESAKVIQPSMSVRWEEQTLNRLSSGTARRLVAECTKARDRERLTAIVERRHEVEGKREQVKEESPPSSDPTSRTKKDSELQSDASHMKQSCPVEDPLSHRLPEMTPLGRSFLTELQEGAVPVHQRRGDGRTVVLDNNAHFDKVVQSTYPQQPRDWCKTETTDTAAGMTYVRGYLKWTDLPQRAKVSAHIFTPHCCAWKHLSTVYSTVGIKYAFI